MYLLIIILHMLLLQQYQLLTTELGALAHLLLDPIELLNTVLSTLARATLLFYTWLITLFLTGRGPHFLACRLIAIFALTASLFVSATLCGFTWLSALAWGALCRLVGVPGVARVDVGEALSFLTSDHVLARRLLQCLTMKAARSARGRPWHAGGPTTAADESSGAHGPSGYDSAHHHRDGKTLSQRINEWRKSAGACDNAPEVLSSFDDLQLSSFSSDLSYEIADLSYDSTPDLTFGTELTPSTAAASVASSSASVASSSASIVDDDEQLLAGDEQQLPTSYGQRLLADDKQHLLNNDDTHANAKKHITPHSSALSGAQIERLFAPSLILSPWSPIPVEVYVDVEVQVDEIVHTDDQVDEVVYVDEVVNVDEVHVDVAEVHVDVDEVRCMTE
ncbi:hypothetical protein BD626DRAFT_251508 [Schizophyllum amplum]|uniref:Uncharacterized protein n=1 Tax=Schizophyllum amplum TaxID=97359 RepID=A0A550CHT9_9AGAR|nr:hypothetical protein BD626DRAFT_251508 [Auriculariopsis ampla]